jgi:RNA polymerase sigma-70 factor (ECF subfamily)
MGSRPSSDEQLLERARNGDRAAQHELWRAHRRWVAAIILAHRPRWAELEDLLQDVAVKLIGKIHTLRDAEAFRPWLRQVAINVCRGEARSHRSALHLGSSRAAEAADREPGHVAEPAAPADAAGDLESWDAAHRLLERALGLPLAYREPLLLRCVRSMTYQQISEVLELPVTTVETRLARARRMLREEIAEAETRPEKP